MLKSLYRFISPKFQNIFLDYKVDLRPRSVLPKMKSIIEEGREVYKTELESFLSYTTELHEIKSAKSEKGINTPAWNNGFLPGLDIVALYCMLRNKRPQKYVEVGSGNSTKVAAKAITDGNLPTQITSIDPYPRANIDHLADEVIRQPLENLRSHEIFEELNEGDFLFIDNSHRCLPNSDVTVFFLEILPILKKGVIVHIHDIYLPFDYPRFMCERAYSEQYILAATLMANPYRYKTLLPNYFISKDENLKQILEPIWNHPNLRGVERHGGSYWLIIGDS